MKNFRRIAAPAAAAAALAAACSSNDPVAPSFDPNLVRVDSIDASGGWTYLRLADPSRPLALTDAQARTSTAWDVAFRGYDTKINSGETGPGDVSALCLCQNTASVAAQPPAQQVAFFRALTADGEAGDFAAVTPAQVRPAADFVADTLASIRNWWTQNAAGARAVRTQGVYVVHRPNGLGYAKVQFLSAQNTTGAAPGQVTFQFATTPPSRAAFAPTQQASVTVPAAGRVFFSFTSGVVTPNDPYDLLFEGWRVRTNSGALSNVADPARRSWGAYDATVDLGPQSTTSFDGTSTRAVANTPFGYVPDGAGEFNRRPTWFYDFATNTPFPNYDVYLVRRGAAVWKLQVIRHPREATFGSGQWLSRFVLFRTSQLAG